MTVYFIGAGPGAPDLITLRGHRLVQRCRVLLYAGSLVPRELLQDAPAHARKVDTASLTLDEIVAEITAASGRGLDVARLHSGDPSLYGAIGEQMRRLDDLGIDYELVPGVPSFAAAAALLRRELTLPGLSQTLILTRTARESSPMPPGEDLASLGRSGATLAIHLSVRNLTRICAELEPHYGGDCPVAVVYRASWPEERVVWGTLGDIAGRVRRAKLTRSALVLVGPVLCARDFQASRLYDPDHVHLLRPRRADRSAHRSPGPARPDARRATPKPPRPK